MLTRYVLACALGAALSATMIGCGRDEGVGGAQRSQPTGVPQEPTKPDDLRTGQGNVGGSSATPGDPGVSGETGSAQEGGTGTATESGEIIGNQPSPKKQPQKR